ncbi:hypothetical protein RhiTH_011023 [Rhizoctonia solani]
MDVPVSEPRVHRELGAHNGSDTKPLTLKKPHDLRYPRAAVTTPGDTHSPASITVAWPSPNALAERSLTWTSVKGMQSSDQRPRCVVELFGQAISNARRNVDMDIKGICTSYRTATQAPRSIREPSGVELQFQDEMRSTPLLF